MSKRIDCDIIRDLLPSYVDGQTSNITNKMIQEHLDECEECRNILRRMKEPDILESTQEKEIDYLKKVKKSHKRKTIIVTLVTLLTGLIISGSVIFVRGSLVDCNAFSSAVSVNDNIVSVNGELFSSGDGVARISFKEKDGIVDMKLYTAPITPFSKGSINTTYTAKTNNIKAVTCGDYVLWESGKPISSLASKLYHAKNPYVGDMPANKRVADVIDVNGYFGSYSNKLQTSKKPYGWTIILDEEVDPKLESNFRDKMQSDACLMIASIDNLSTVTWKYRTGTGEKEYTITEKDASKRAGTDIKSFAKSASGMERLVHIVR